MVRACKNVLGVSIISQHMWSKNSVLFSLDSLHTYLYKMDPFSQLLMENG